VGAEVIDQITFTPEPEYVFHHPLVRIVAYEAQLKSDRAELHRRLAAAIEARVPESIDENAALIAEHSNRSTKSAGTEAFTFERFGFGFVG
jgi:adenylate cyclase